MKDPLEKKDDLPKKKSKRELSVRPQGNDKSSKRPARQKNGETVSRN